MSHFYMSGNGSAKSEATRRGFKNQGIHAHVRGWNLGIFVEGSHEGGKDVFRVYKTSGSNGSGMKMHIQTVKDET